MAQMYRIYINDVTLILNDIAPEHITNYQEIDNQHFNILLFYQQVKAEKLSGRYLFLSPNPSLLFRKIKKSFKIVRAAGGIVRNEENKILFIFRNGKWDLPKGKLDKGEKPRQAAVREVEEECGITVKSIGSRVCKTWHIYEFGGQEILKRTSWYNMEAFNQNRLIPQKAEGITKAKWLAIGDFKKVSEATYPLIADMINEIEI